MNSKRMLASRYLAESYRPYLLIFTCAIIVFYSIFRHYGYMDSYEYLYKADNENFLNIFIQGGRPIFGVLNKFLLTSIATIEQLEWIRLLGVVGLLVFLCVFYRVLVFFWSDAAFALVATLGVLFSPSAGIIGGWMMTYQIGWALALSFLAGFIVVQILTVRREAWTHIGWSLVALILSLAGLMLYQPAYPVFIIPGLLLFLKNRDLRTIILVVGVNFLIYVIYFLSFKAILALMALPPLDRAGTATNPLEKLQWFFRWPLLLTYEDNFLFYRSGMRKFAALSFVILTVYYLFSQVKSNLEVAGKFLLVLGALLFLCYVPNLISADNWVSCRTLPVLFVFKWIFIALALRELHARFPFVKYGIVALMIWLLANAWYNLNDGFVNIQVQEYELVKSELNRMLPELEEKKEMIFVIPEYDFYMKNKVLRKIVSDEFGNASTARDWVPDPMVRQILREANHTDLESSLKIRLLRGPQRDSIPPTNSSPVLDYEKLYLREYR